MLEVRWQKRWISNGFGRPKTRAIAEDWSVSERTEEGSMQSVIDATSREQAIEQVNYLIEDLQDLRKAIMSRKALGPVPEYLTEWVEEGNDA